LFGAIVISSLTCGIKFKQRARPVKDQLKIEHGDLLQQRALTDFFGAEESLTSSQAL